MLHIVQYMHANPLVELFFHDVYFGRQCTYVPVVVTTPLECLDRVKYPVQWWRLLSLRSGLRRLSLFHVSVRDDRGCGGRKSL